MEIIREAVRMARPSHESTISNGSAITPSTASSNTSDEVYRRFSNESVNGGTTAASVYSTASARMPHSLQQTRHVIHLSSIEHCMPRAYIRVCLAYRLPDTVALEDVVTRLNLFARKIVDSKPYLAGYVVPAPTSVSHPGLAEIHFTDCDFLNFPQVEVRHMTDSEIPHNYEQLSKAGLPPSLIRPELVSALPEGTNDEYAPVFRIQANVVRGGLIVSMYLHHCISDGTGMGLIITGSLLHDDFTFDCHLEAKGFDTSGLNRRLEEFANQQSIVRNQLSWSFPNQIRNRHFQWITPRSEDDPSPKVIGRGVVFAFSKQKLRQLRLRMLEVHGDTHFMSPNDVLQALLWHHMTAARAPSLKLAEVRSSTLFTPVNIRSKIHPPLSDSYFGAAVDFATTELPIATLSICDHELPLALAQTAVAIRAAISRVDEAYIRQSIALARDPDPEIDVRDLMGSNMNRATGADMYITSWEKLDLYGATLELGLGRPDWVRKPWSRDPGSCIVLPNDSRRQVTEVLVQMTGDDMGRLMDDSTFLGYVERWIE